MSESRVAARYAKSLLDLAKEKNLLKEIHSDMSSLLTILNKQADLWNVLKSPIIKSDKKSQVMHSLFDSKFQTLTLGFFDILLRKKRESFVKEIAQAFIQQYNVMNGIIQATVTTANAADAAFGERMASFIEQQTGKKVELHAQTNPELIGGVVIQVGDKLFDASIAGKLRQIKQELTNTYISK